MFNNTGISADAGFGSPGDLLKAKAAAGSKESQGAMRKALEFVRELQRRADEMIAKRRVDLADAGFGKRTGL